MRNRVLRAGTVAAAWICLNLPATAHEFWVDPDAGLVAPGSSISVDMRVGQDLSGAALPYLNTTFAAMTHWSPRGPKAVEARLGDRPVIGELALSEPGLHRITVETHPAYIVFDTLAEFEEYLAYEGQDAIGLDHRERGLPAVDIAEEYLRNARALVQVGPVLDGQWDAPTGMPFELVVEGNPFAANPGSVRVRLLWNGEPMGLTQVNVFHLAEGAVAPDGTERTVVQTDGDGIAEISMEGPGQYLLNAVRLDPVEGPGSVVWKSHWASLTFRLPPE